MFTLFYLHTTISMMDACIFCYGYCATATVDVACYFATVVNYSCKKHIRLTLGRFLKHVRHTLECHIQLHLLQIFVSVCLTFSGQSYKTFHTIFTPFSNKLEQFIMSLASLI
jgi:hypothetical protein